MATPTALQKKLPMYATTARFVAAPFLFVVLLGSPLLEWVAAAIFILGSLTDWLDGYWARKYNAESNMGKLMDPVADKVLVLTALILLVSLDRIGPAAPALLLSRDIFIGGIRSAAAADGVVISAKPTGKWKTALQMVGLPFLFIAENRLNLPLVQIGTVIVWVSVVLSVLSAVEYTRAFLKKEST